MKRIGNQLMRAIDCIYNIYGNINSIGVLDSSVINYSKNNIFTLFCKALIKKNRIEFPLFAKNTIQNIIFKTIDEGLDLRIKNIIIPYYSSNREYKYKTTNTLFYSLSKYLSTYSSGMYIGVEDAHGIKYYGGNGAIFNNDMVPLFFNTMEYEIINNCINCEKVNSYIHPSVFYSDNPIEKLIVTKVIPHILQNGVRISIGNSRIRDNLKKSRDSLYTFPDFKIVDITDRFFYKPTLPNVLYTDDDINDMLDRNIEDVFNALNR